MDTPYPFDPEQLDADLGRGIDAACRAFEDHWRAGQVPRIEDRLEDVAERGRAALLVELIALECELLAGRGTPPQPADYLARFPGREREVARAFATRETPSASDQPARVAETIAPASRLDLPPTEMPTGAPARTAGTAGAETLLVARSPADVTSDFVLDAAPVRPDARRAGDPTKVRYFGDYLLERELARGGMGVVYRARQVNLNRVVALKMILAGQLASEGDVKRFYLEAESAANLDHPGIVPIFEVGQHEGQHFFSMGFVEGQSLAQAIAEHPLPPRQAAALMVQLAEAVQYAHDRGVIHRDLKPGNVLLDPQGRPRVTDFGLAKKLQGDSGLTATGQVMGTPSYMPPEQAAGKAEIDHLADVYSLGAVLYCMLTGRPPFQAAGAMDTLIQVLEREPVPPRQLNAQLPKDLETITLKALEKAPARRYASAKALGADVERWLRGEPIVARPASRAEKLVKWSRRRPAIAGLLIAVVLIGLAGLSGIVWQWGRAERNLTESEKNRKIAEANYEEAKVQRKLAEANFEEAKAQRKIAETRTAEAQTRAEALERQGYVSLIAISQRETQANNLALSDRLLQRCPTHLRGWEWRYASRANHAELATIKPLGHDYAMCCVPSPDRRRFVCFTDQHAWICDREGKELGALETHPEAVSSAAWSPDGKTIATGCRDRLIRLWDAETRKAHGLLRGHGIWVTTLCFSPDGTQLLSGAGADPLVPGRRHEVRLWDLAGLREIHTLLSGPGGGVIDVAFAPDGKRVAGGTVGGGAHVWDAETGRQIRMFSPSPHQGGMDCVTFSPDGRLLASGSGAGVISLWDIESGSLVKGLQGHDGTVNVIRFTRDGRRIASAGRDATVRLWSAEDGREQAVLRGHFQSIRQLEFAESGTRLVSASYDGTIRVWDATIETLPAAITGHLGSTHTLSFHPDGKTLATGGWGGIYIWDAASGRRLGTIHNAHPGGAAAIAYSPDGRQLAAVGKGPLAQVWDTATGQLLHAFDTRTTACTAVVYSRDGANLIIGDDQGYVRTWNLASASEATRFRAHEERIVGFSLAPDGRRLVTATPGDLVKVWDLPNGRERLAVKTAKSHTFPTTQIAVFDHSGRRLAVRKENHAVAIVDAGEGWVVRTLEGHSDEINVMAFSPDDRRLATAGSDQTVRLWDPDRGDEMLTLFGRHASVSAVAWSRDGRYLAAVGDGEGRVWDAGPSLAAVRDVPLVPAEVARFKEIDCGDGKGLERVAYAPDGKTLALGCNGGEVSLLDTTTQAVRARLRGLTAPAVALAFSTDGTLLAAGSGDWKTPEVSGRIRLWDPRTGAAIGDLPGVNQAVWTVRFSPDGKTLASGASDGLVTLWDPLRRVRRTQLATTERPWVRGLAFTPDGKFLASSHMAMVRLWDLATQKPIAQLEGHTEEINALAISPDGKRLATASRDRTVVLWDLATQHKPTTIAREKGWVTDVAFSRDGSTLAFSVIDGSVRLWDVAAGRLRMSGHNPSGMAMCAGISPDGSTVAAGQVGVILWRFGMEKGPD